MNKRRYISLLILFVFSMFIMGCAEETPVAQADPDDYVVQSTYIEPLADSMDECLVVHVDTEESKIQFYNLKIARTYTLEYNHATGIKNRFGDELVAEQLSDGDMVRVTFIKDEKLIKNVQILSDVETVTDVKDFEINSVSKTMSYGGEQYKVSKNAMVLSKGNLLELNEVNTVDTLKVVAKNHEVLGITIEKGHGYVRLSGQDNFIDGFVEVGQDCIKKVTPEMLLVVPEGEYSLFISKGSLSGSEDITVLSGEEIEVDVSKFEVTDEKKTGKIIFTITPAKAKLYIDGEETEYDKPVEMICGIHQIKVKADGYKTLTQYIKVGQSTANLNLELEEGEDSGDDSDQNENKPSASLSENAIAATTDGGYRVYIDAPVGIELYVEGNYVGIIPTSFAKKEGSFVASLRKDGFQTRSYTLQLDKAEKDVHYSFSDLTAK